MTGSGSTWTNFGRLYVGHFGNGTLNIEDSGTVLNIIGHIGNGIGSTGTVTVTGSGSTWTNSSYLAVGHFGTGTLNINNSGIVTAGAETRVSSGSTLSINGGSLTTGEYEQKAGGTLQFNLDVGIDGSIYSELTASGIATIDGTLDVNCSGTEISLGDRFDILTASSVNGTFVTETLPSLSGNIELAVVYMPTTVTLVATPELAGDFNIDGTVDAADYTVWRDSLGSATNLIADANLNAIVDSADYGIWKANFGNSLPTASSIASIPEPTGILFLLASIAPVGTFSRHI